MSWNEMVLVTLKLGHIHYVRVKITAILKAMQLYVNRYSQS